MQGREGLLDRIRRLEAENRELRECGQNRENQLFNMAERHDNAIREFNNLILDVTGERDALRDEREIFRIQNVNLNNQVGNLSNERNMEEIRIKQMEEKLSNTTLALNHAYCMVVSMTSRLNDEGGFKKQTIEAYKDHLKYTKPYDHRFSTLKFVIKK